MEKSLAKGSYTIKDLKLPIFHFLQQFCGVYPYMDLTDLKPIVADEALSEIFQIQPGTPLLQMDEVDFDIDGKPVFCSREYFADGFSATPSCAKAVNLKPGRINMKKVAVIMGSDSDWPVVKGACAQLRELGIPYEAHILSAHRTPAAAANFARSARANGFGVLICAAGMAAHLAGLPSPPTPPCPSSAFP